MDVEEGDDVAFLDRLAVDVLEISARLVDDADGDVAGDDRERDVELAVMEMDVGAADLGVESLEECGAGL